MVYPKRYVAEAVQIYQRLYIMWQMRGSVPVRNITMQPAPADKTGRVRKRPSWGQDCAGCLACYHVCPRHAVMYGKATVGKGQYMNPMV